MKNELRPERNRPTQPENAEQRVRETRSRVSALLMDKLSENEAGRGFDPYDTETSRSRLKGWASHQYRR
ncbi:MAG: hypothetical protein R3E77_08190 [Steroidobacteraceae bacterium]